MIPEDIDTFDSIPVAPVSLLNFRYCSGIDPESSVSEYWHRKRPIKTGFLFRYNVLCSFQLPLIMKSICFPCKITIESSLLFEFV